MDEDVANFCAITGASTDQAETYLHLADGNLDAAVGLYLENSHMGISLEQQERAQAAIHEPPPAVQRNTQDFSDDFGGFPDAAAPTSARMLDDDGYRAPIAPRQDVLIGPDAFHGGEGAYFHPMPPIGPSIRDPFQMDSDEEIDSDEDDEAHQTRRRLAQLFAPPRSIMFQGSFEQAREMAKQRKKWMIVTLHDPSEFACQTLNRDLWKEDQVQAIVRESFVFQQFIISSSDGQQYRNFYPVESVPHIAIIDPRTGERVKIWHTAPTVQEFMIEVLEFLDTNSLESKKSKKKDSPERTGAASSSSAGRNLDGMTEDEQLAAAIAASVSELSSPQEDAEKAPANPVDEIEALERPDPGPTEDATTIQFRTPDGSRIIKKFAKDDLVQVLYQHVKAILPTQREKSFDVRLNRIVCLFDMTM